MQFKCVVPGVAGLAFVLCTAPAVHAHVIYNNFGSGGAHVGNGGATVGNAMFFEAHIEVAAAFTVSGGDYFLNSVHLVVGHLWGPNYFTVSVYDSDGKKPGNNLGTVTVLDQLLPLPNDPDIWNPAIIVDFDNSIVLEDGVMYWVVVGPHETEDAWLAWNDNSTGATGLIGNRADGGEWNVAPGITNPVFSVHGTLVPAPGAGAMLALMLCARRRRRE